MGNSLAFMEEHFKAYKIGNVTDKKNSNVEDVKKQKLNKKPKLENPGSVDDLHKDCSDVLPVPFEGGKLSLNKCLSNNFQLIHNLHLLPEKEKSSYKFGAIYVGRKNCNQSEVCPLMIGEIERNGNMQANIIHNLTNRTRIKFAADYQGRNLLGGQLLTDYLGETFTATVGTVNPNFVNKSGIFVAKYLQSVGKNWSFGSEFFCQHSFPYPGVLSAFNVLAKCKEESFTFSSTMGATGIRLSYMMVASDQLKIGVEFNTNYDANSTFATFGYEATIPKADLVCRASVDSNWNVCSVLEKRLKPLPLVFSLSSLLNQKTGKFRLGCGLTVG